MSKYNQVYNSENLSNNSRPEITQEGMQDVYKSCNALVGSLPACKVERNFPLTEHGEKMLKITFCDTCPNK